MNVVPHPAAAARGAEAPKLIERMRRPIRVRHYSIRLEGTVQLIVMLLYGTGMRILECLRLRIQDIDFDLGNISIRNGKGKKDRTTLLCAGFAMRA